MGRNKSLKELNLPDNVIVVYGKGMPSGKVTLTELLLHFDMEIYEISVPHDRMHIFSALNKQLPAFREYEYLCRAAESEIIYCINCDSDSDKQISPAKDVAVTLAYLFVKYMDLLRREGQQEALLQKMTAWAKDRGCETFFLQVLLDFMKQSEPYQKIVRETAPWFIIVPDDTCFGMLRLFARCLAGALLECGQSVMTSDGSVGGTISFEKLSERLWKGIIGFQAPALEGDFFRKIRAPKIQFWFDNPCLFKDMLRELPEGYRILCQDAGYAEFIRNFYHTSGALQFLPGGIVPAKTGSVEKKYDIVFLGSYFMEEPTAGTSQEIQFFSYMINHPHKTFEKGLRDMCSSEGRTISDEELVNTLYDLRAVCHNVAGYFRQKVIETILEAGYVVDVFGNSWNHFQTNYPERLRIHPAIPAEQSSDVLAQTKISLNVMTWHKSGMTERIASTMLAGALCLSDETVYLKEHFTENEELVLFQLEHLELIPEKLAWLLGEREPWKSIAGRGYAKACMEHTWYRRAEQLLELLDR